MNLGKTSAEQQLELQNEVASLQTKTENINTELSRKEQQLTEVLLLLP